MEAKHIKRFFSKLSKTESCWYWKACKNNSGYGGFHYKGKTYGAHVFSFMIHKGPVSKGDYVCHTCDTPDCVNPDHLFKADQFINMQDCVTKGRFPAAEKEFCIRGHDLSNHFVRIRNGNYTRVCKQCHTIKMREYYERKKNRSANC